MWTYMMAAARGDRANSMLSSRRRTESESSPKYGYNLTRPLYRTTRLTGTHAGSTGLCNQYQQYPQYGNQMFHHSNSYASHHHVTSAAPAFTAAPPSTSSNHSQNSQDEEDSSFFGPMSNENTTTTANTNTNNHHASNLGERNSIPNHILAVSRSENVASVIEQCQVDRTAPPVSGQQLRSSNRRASSINDDEEVDYLESVMENGKQMSKDQTKETKPSALRRTLNALRHRITKRSRNKPPDWFLDKFSTVNNAEKIGKSATADVPEITGKSWLCNRLSVDPSLPSHYRWLFVVSVAVLYNIIFVMGRAVFWEINRSASPVWYFLDYLCDLIYLLDTLVHMHEGYLEQGLLVRDAYKLRKHYFSTKGWSIDVLSMLPTDLVYIWWPPTSCSSTYLPCPVIVRLNRLLRLPRMWEWFDRTETATGYPNAFRICKVVLAILVLIHWNACMYFAISYALGFGTDNWVYNLKGDRNATLQRQYIYSFYWSTLTLTTIGETPTPENDAEYLFVVADFLAGVLIFATIVGNIGSMISNMNVARVEFQNRMDGVKQYMAFRKVGNELEARVIRWFAYTWSQSGALDEERVLSALPDKLKAEIAIRVHMDTLKQVRIFQDCEPGLLEALVLKLKLQVFSPGDYICRKGDVGKEMYIVKRGKLSVVADDGVTVFATLGAGSVFGEVSVLEIAGNRTGNRRTANVRSLGYSDLFCLAKRDLWETLADYPEARATLTERGCQLLRKDGLLDEDVFSNSQRVQDSIEGGIEKLEVSVENLNVRLARLLAEYTASQAKLKQRLAKLEVNAQLTTKEQQENSQKMRSSRLYSLPAKKRRQRPISSKSADCKQNTL
ncbi:cyclic nucleotide-gated cation channel subunit A [Episyrphus balteatus]|uniref:cyclic nucleotide-gated cation channel subunit A n=1 Tax=Episyrphus balteatus TaxID=286459 RepID=UPI0024858578|nr:cyclic nucleotide-gated cation channel subunit A [Episyrphus balteatus]